MSILRIGLAAIAVAISGAARAQNYPWCSNFHDGAGTNCGFSTYEQCMATARGSGGYCVPNNLYVAPGGPGRGLDETRKPRVRRGRARAKVG